VTDSFVAEAGRVVPPCVTIDGATGRFGAAIVTAEAENVIGGHSALDLMARHGHCAGFCLRRNNLGGRAPGHDRGRAPQYCASAVGGVRRAP
jgi:hypothetical protein